MEAWAMYIGNARDFHSGLIFIFFGVAALLLARGYPIGGAAKMGPGYFPFVLGGMLTILGLAISLRSLSRKRGGRKPPSFQVKPLVLVLSSVALFGLLLRPLGLLLSSIVLVLVSSLASHEFKRREAILNALVLLLIVIIIFVYFLQFQIPIWPSFLGGQK